MGSSKEHQGPRDAQRNKEIEESARSAPRICTPRTWPERDAKKAKEEIVKNVAESMQKCNQHEQILRSGQQRGCCSVKLRSENKSREIVTTLMSLGLMTKLYEDTFG